MVVVSKLRLTQDNPDPICGMISPAPPGDFRFCSSGFEVRCVNTLADVKERLNTLPESKPEEPYRTHHDDDVTGPSLAIGRKV